MNTGVIVDMLEKQLTSLIVALDGENPNDIVDQAASMRSIITAFENIVIVDQSEGFRKSLVKSQILIDDLRLKVKKMTDLYSEGYYLGNNEVI